MQNPTLVIMAAGLGSRFGAGGGKKQITPVDERGHLMIEYSVYDAIRAGFDKVVFVVKPESERVFHEAIGESISKYARVEYAHQTHYTYLPEGFVVPEGRVKPWGTGHAALCARDHVPGACVVINADDFYGRDAYVSAYKFLTESTDEREHAMVGYRLRNTMTENGSVARGVCTVNDAGELLSVIERTKITARDNDAVFTEDGETYEFISGDATVSLNFWAFKHTIFDEMRARFPNFLREEVPKNPLGAEYFLPSIPDQLLRENKARVRVLPTHAIWYGITYLSDMERTMAGIKDLRRAGEYPEYFWEAKPC